MAAVNVPSPDMPRAPRPGPRLHSTSGHFTVGGSLPGVRETQSHLNNPSLVDELVRSARYEGAPVDCLGASASSPPRRGGQLRHGFLAVGPVFELNATDTETPPAKLSVAGESNST